MRLHHLLLPGLVALIVATPAFAGGVAILDTLLTDNGDGDGFADTRETVELRLTVQNTAGSDLTGVTLRLAPRDPSAVCLTSGEIGVGDLAAGEIRTTTGAFVFTVLDVDRGTLGLGPLDPFSITFDVGALSSPAAPAVPSRLTLDLDLDTSGGSGPTTFFESFEGTLGAFEVDNIDAGRHSYATSDGYRCQYNDPDAPNGNGDIGNDCYLGSSPLQADAVFWDLSGPAFSPLGGRGFSGFHSLFFGIDLGPPENWTSPIPVLEGARTSNPIHIGHDAVSPKLSMKHMVSVVDSRCAGLPDGHSYDRAVVMAQVSAADGTPAGPWIKLDPYQNPYDQQNAPNIFNCAFDPIDDGSTEDDFFDPSDPERRYGPSSTCYPEYAFVNIGESSNAFHPDNVGRADGPGLAGSWGIGTWIESSFDLSRFRGRSLRLRFLASQIKGVDGFDDWEQIFAFNPIPCDDGWWVDDVTVTDALSVPATVAGDANPNLGLPGPPTDDLDTDGIFDVCDNCAGATNADQADDDLDGLGDACDPCPNDAVNFDPDADLLCGPLDNCPFDANPDQLDGDSDGAGTACDCSDGDPAVYPGAEEINDGSDNQCPGDAGHGLVDETSSEAVFQNAGTYWWPQQAGAARYRAVRASSADFTAACVDFGKSPDNYVVDPDVPPNAGDVYYYVNRAEDPNIGSWGASSTGVERTVPCAL